MRLFTHNMLVCHVQGCGMNNFPLALSAQTVTFDESDFNPDFIRHMLGKLEWTALINAISQTGQQAAIGSLPTALTDDLSENEDFLKAVHKACVELNVTEGYLECPNCHRRYPISGGVPNMLLRAEELQSGNQ